jgi:hypothetical protein
MDEVDPLAPAQRSDPPGIGEHGHRVLRGHRHGDVLGGLRQSATMRPPWLITNASCPASTSACAISTVVSSAPPVSSSGTICKTRKDDFPAVLSKQMALAIPPSMKRKMALSCLLLSRPWSPQLAYEKTDGNVPTLVWLGGFRSDMTGSKAMKVEEYAKERGQACLRFDYAGHGQSTGAFTDGTIGSWQR